MFVHDEVKEKRVDVRRFAKERKEKELKKKEKLVGSVGRACTCRSCPGMHETLQESGVFPDVDLEGFRCPPARHLYDCR